VGERWLAKGAENLQDLFHEGVVIETRDTFFGKMFTRLKGILRWFGPAVAGANAVLSTIDFAHALSGDEDDKQKAYVGIVACAAILETVFLVAELCTEMAVFPPAAAVMAIIGLVFTLVMILDPPRPPNTPVENFLDDVVRPFVGTLVAPPNDWEPLVTPAKYLSFRGR